MNEIDDTMAALEAAVIDLKSPPYTDMERKSAALDVALAAFVGAVVRERDEAVKALADLRDNVVKANGFIDHGEVHESSGKYCLICDGMDQDYEGVYHKQGCPADPDERARAVLAKHAKEG